MARLAMLCAQEIMSTRGRRISESTRGTVGAAITLIAETLAGRPTSSTAAYGMIRKLLACRERSKGASYALISYALLGVSVAYFNGFVSDEVAAEPLDHERFRELVVEARVIDACGRRPRDEVYQAFREMWLAGHYDRAYELASFGAPRRGRVLAWS